MKRAKSEKTLLSDKSRIEGHIKPKLGKLPVASVTTQDIEDFMHAVAAGETAHRAKTGKKRGYPTYVVAWGQQAELLAF
jgi:hypothetical protein